MGGSKKLRRTIDELVEAVDDLTDAIDDLSKTLTYRKAVGGLLGAQPIRDYVERRMHDNPYVLTYPKAAPTSSSADEIINRILRDYRLGRPAKVDTSNDEIARKASDEK